MRSFKQFIVEEYVFLTKEFIKNVENYIFKNETKYLKNIVKHKSNIPAMFKSPKTLYRGVLLNEIDLEKLTEGKFVFKDYTSWTSDKTVAKRFILDSSKRTKAAKKGIGIIFVKDMSKEIILDVHAYISYLNSTGKLDEVGFDETTLSDALDEYECICEKNIKLSSKNVFKQFEIK